jgi:DNA-binding beta-propeller fold protein YncE
MTEPPHEPPEGPFEEEPEEPERFRESSHEPDEVADDDIELEDSYEPGGGLSPPPYDRHDEAVERHESHQTGEPPHDPHGARETGGRRELDDSDPTHEPYAAHHRDDPDDAPSAADDFEAAPRHESGEHSEEPPRERGDDLFGGAPEAEGPRDHPTGELFDEDLDEATGELFEEPVHHTPDPDDESPSPPTGELLLDLGEEVHSATELAQRRAQERAQRRRAGRQRLLVLILAVVVVVVIVVLVTNGGSSAPTSTTAAGDPLAASGTGASHLAAGSAAALPGNILVADRNNNRLLAISPQGQIVWQAGLTGPSAAFPSSTGRSVLVTQPGEFVVLALAVSDRKSFYRYGLSRRHGSADNRLGDPETAQELSDGTLVIADKSNCRVIFVKLPSHRPHTKLGRPGSCVHDPPKTLANPDAVFPAIGGGIVVTELDPKWVDVLSTQNAIVASMQVPGLGAPDDANEYAPGKLIATSHAHPGSVEEFDTADKVTWTYDPSSGPGELDRPSLAEVLPNGDVLVCDSGNDRIVVIDPQTKTIVWQYGHTGKPGTKPGYLHTPDTAVLVGAAS